MSEQPLKVITANQLKEGLIVYMILNGDQHSWTHNMADATTFDADSVAAAQAIAAKDVAANLIVDAYPVDIDDSKTPLTQREKIRAGGPTQPYGKAAVKA